MFHAVQHRAHFIYGACGFLMWKFGIHKAHLFRHAYDTKGTSVIGKVSEQSDCVSTKVGFAM